MHMSRRVIVGMNHDFKTILTNNCRHGFRLYNSNRFMQRRVRYRTVWAVTIQHDSRRLANLLGGTILPFCDGGEPFRLRLALTS